MLNPQPTAKCRQSTAPDIGTRKKAISSRDKESRIRRDRSLTVEKDEWVAVENPDQFPICAVWLAKVIEPGYRYEGKDKTEDGVKLRKGHFYIQLHVYKPVSVKSKLGVAFKWDPSPHGTRGSSSWIVDAECVVKTKLKVSNFNRQSSRINNEGKDAYELKIIDPTQFKDVMANWRGKLSEM